MELRPLPSLLRCLIQMFLMIQKSFFFLHILSSKSKCITIIIDGIDFREPYLAVKKMFVLFLRVYK
jgi:hypothetical protein